MVAIGVLVPLTFGRLGKSWRHAPRLKELVELVGPTLKNRPLGDTDRRAIDRRMQNIRTGHVQCEGTLRILGIIQDPRDGRRGGPRISSGLADRRPLKTVERPTRDSTTKSRIQ